MRKIALLLVLVLPFVSSCILLPYREEPLCVSGTGEGVCGSLSDVYQDVQEHPEKYCGSCER
ncbi:hypothetical protein [Desulfurobacterium sp. TC5-1]|uniref:hypothetical protein n=1 Tax=Desulfurobacterium sp. TC5-1 TaxID=1158318 RepID=UPI0003B6B6F6|nr:hypothetical protein [Desulfurobacterium sp. TC5-1]